MKEKIFNKFLVRAILILLIFAGVLKIQDVLSFPEIRDWNYHQMQRIDMTKKEFSFAVFGDNKKSVKTFEILINKLNKENIMFAIDNGDLSDDGEKASFEFFINQIKKLRKPLLTVIGNHDTYNKGRTNYYELFGKLYYSFTIGNSYFIILDDVNGKNLGSRQMDWLKNELRKNQDYKYRFVFMHVPLYDPRKGEYKRGHNLGNLAFSKKLNALFDQDDVTMLFVSHIHGYYSGVWGKTPYIITGGAGAELAGSDPQHYFYHYIKVHVSDNGVSYKVVRLKSPDFELDRLIHDAWIYVYTFFTIHFLALIVILALIYLGFYIIFLKRNG